MPYNTEDEEVDETTPSPREGEEGLTPGEIEELDEGLIIDPDPEDEEEWEDEEEGWWEDQDEDEENND